MRRPRLWVVAALLFVAYLAWDMTAYPRGMLAACIDHRRGVDCVWELNWPAPADTAYRRQLLRFRYGVEVAGFGGGSFVPHAATSYADGYNAVSRGYALAKYGKDIFKECADEAGGSKPAATDDK